jgi:hypothetical protein
MRDSPGNCLRRRQGRVAVAVHVLVLPWWLFCWLLAAGVAMNVWFFITVLAVGVVFWITLLIRLFRWAREGREATWAYPVRWAGMTILTIAFAVAFLIPRLRQWLELEPTPVDSFGRPAQ